MSTPRGPDHDLDRLLDDDGGELGALYRRLPKAEPPRRLDRLIVAEAARAVKGARPRRQRWLVALGSAAGIVLAAGIAWRVGQDALHQQDQESTRAGRVVVPVEPISETARSRRRAEDTPLQDSAPPAAAALPSAPMAKAARPKTEHEAVAKPAPMPSSEPVDSPAFVPAPPPQRAAPPATTVAPAPESGGATANGSAATADVLQESDKAKDTRTDGAAATRNRSNAAMPAPSSSAELHRDMQLAPADWLAHIRQLLHQGRTQQAAESLRLFRRAHPDWQLSDELRALGD